MTAAAEHRARVRYTEPMLRLAVRTFVWRSVLRRRELWLSAIALLAIGIALGCLGAPSFLTGLDVAALGFLAVFVAAVWRAHLANTLGRFRAMAPPEADVTFGETSMTVASNLGSATLPWSSFVQVWELPGFWMLFVAPNQFITLPLDTLAPEVVVFLQRRLSQAAVVRTNSAEGK